MTRIGHEGVGIIIVTHRKEGYFASILFFLIQLVVVLI
jgi:hypothetical protein